MKQSEYRKEEGRRRLVLRSKSSPAGDSRCGKGGKTERLPALRFSCAAAGKNNTKEQGNSLRLLCARGVLCGEA